MENDKYVSVEKELVKKILSELNVLVVMTDEKFTRDKLKDVITTLEGFMKEDEKESLIEGLLSKRMKEFKTKDPDLHFKFYMIYRKLQDGKITEEDATSFYKSYFGILE